MSNEKDFSHLYTKLKDIYLELPGFSFFHSPSGRFRDNPKTVGRKRIKRKLYSLLTNSETKTGSYIITGFRGVGKTSIVNQVVNELQPKSIIHKQALALVFTWLVIHQITNTTDISIRWLVIAFVTLFVLNHANVFLSNVAKWFNCGFHKRKRQEQHKKYRDYHQEGKHFFHYIRSQVYKIFNHSLFQLIRLPIVDRNYYSRSNIDKFIYLVFYGLAIEIVISINEEFLNNDSKTVLEDINLLVIVLIYTFFVITAIIGNFISFNGRDRYNEFEKKNPRFLKQLLNHSQKVFVRLSFPQNAVESKDILKSLVNHLHKEFQRYRGFNLVLFKVSLFLFTTFIFSTIYQSTQIQGGFKEWRSNSTLAILFPSQHPENLNHEKIAKIFEDTTQKSLLHFYWNSLGVNENEQRSYSKLLSEYTITIDFYLSWAYLHLYHFLRPISEVKLSGRATLLPGGPDLIFYSWLAVVFILISFVGRLGRSFGLVTHQHVKKLLKELNEKCLAEIEVGREKELNYSRWNASLGFRKKRNLQYPIASARDIENELIHIFDEVDRIPKIFAPPEFIFIFDELDKIEPLKNEDKSIDEDLEGSLESEKVRKKRDVVAGIMASMKIFFTTAKAKFIFIAGREMYDASLADNSDRESYLGSIFHDIIYVSSLYKDPFDDHSSRIRRPVDITYWTERYVCQLLLPRNKNFKRNLEGYSKYLREYLDEKIKNKNLDPEVAEYQFKKVINTVSVFINYLAFRSKGSPMNLFKLFEDFAEEFPHRKSEIFLDQDKLIIGKSAKSFYLTFDFQAQYRISFVAGIFRPFVIDHGIFLKNYSDKILVSTAYLLDHIYKFHEFGFSWRNLELLPEIIDINRAPLLRRHVEKIISFLSDSNLKRVDNGFINFKFHRKLLEEINYLSRRSDTESATFNFTLDESYAIKRHYRGRLSKLIREYQRYGTELNGFVNSISFLESILGDLHFFDKEYDEAVIQYADGVQMLRSETSENWNLHQTFLFIRTMLKEALVFERMNTYEPAFTKYAELVEIIRKHGKRIKNISEKDQKKRLGEPLEWPYDSLATAISDENRANYHFAKSLYENFSLMHLAILAKLAIIEKIGKQGITLKDSLRADRDFHSVYYYLKKDERFLIKADYHLQKGDILFYKNGYLYGSYSGNAKNSIHKYGYPIDYELHKDYNGPFSACEEYIVGTSLVITKFCGLDFLGCISPKFGEFYKWIELDDRSLDNPVTGSIGGDINEIEKYSHFEEGIRLAWQCDTSKYEKSLLLSAFSFLTFENDVRILNVTGKVWHTLGRLLSALGDCLLIMCPEPKIDNLAIDLDLLFQQKDFDKLEAKLKTESLSRTEVALLYFACASRCYKRADEIRNSAFQNKKILFTLKSYVRYFERFNFYRIKETVENYLSSHIIEQLNTNRHLIIFPEYSKSKQYKSMLRDESQNIPKKLHDYYRFSYNTEVKLSILHYFDLNLTDFKSSRFSWDQQGGSLSDFMLKKVPINAYNTIGDQMVRMFELRFKSRLNRKCLLLESSHYCGDDDVLELDGHIQFAKLDPDEIKYLIIDSIFCELRIIEGINLGEITYIKGFFYLASSYMSLGWWIEAWGEFLSQNGNLEKDKWHLMEMIGSHEMHYIDNPEYAYRKAQENYYKCINVHSEGDSYREMLSNLYFTEGDHSDDNQHFCAAFERWLINNKVVRKRIELVKKKIKTLEKESIFRGVIQNQSLVLKK